MVASAARRRAAEADEKERAGSWPVDFVLKIVIFTLPRIFAKRFL
jgi:hypothetical protein